MPHSKTNKHKDGAGMSKKGQPASGNSAEGEQPQPPAEPTGNHTHNGNGNHDRRRSGRVTYRPKATEMLTVHARTEDERLLSPRHRPAFLDSDPWRSLRIMSEFVEGFDALAAVGKAVTIFGSARTVESDPYYAKARELAALLAKEGFAVITGGGPGIMEAANRGCHEAGGLSIGCNIELPHEQSVNPYVDHFPGRFRNSGRTVRVADADPDRQDPPLPGGSGRD